MTAAAVAASLRLSAACLRGRVVAMPAALTAAIRRRTARLGRWSVRVAIVSTVTVPVAAIPVIAVVVPSAPIPAIVVRPGRSAEAEEQARLDGRLGIAIYRRAVAVVVAAVVAISRPAGRIRDAAAERRHGAQRNGGRSERRNKTFHLSVMKTRGATIGARSVCHL